MRVKTKVTAFALAVTGLLAAGCSDNNDTPSEAAKYITVSTSIGQMTRVETDDDGSQRFVSEDEITIYAWLGTATEQSQMVVNGVTNRYDGTAWTAETPMLWADQKRGIISSESTLCARSAVSRKSHSPSLQRATTTYWWHIRRML